MDLNFNGRANGFYNGNEWEVNLEMKMDKLMDRLMGSDNGKRFDYNELIMDNEWWVRLTILEQTLNYNGI